MPESFSITHFTTLWKEREIDSRQAWPRTAARGVVVGTHNTLQRCYDTPDFSLLRLQLGPTIDCWVSGTGLEIGLATDIAETS
jgi:hypothetical protein